MTTGALVVLACAGPVGAQTLTQDEALALAFPGAEVERRTAFLDDTQLARASSLTGPDVDVESTVVTYYVAMRRGEPAGVAYFDADRVRTLPQVLMIVVGTDGRVVRVETVNITGATLTSGAVTRATRRVMALHSIIDPFGVGAR